MCCAAWHFTTAASNALVHATAFARMIPTFLLLALFESRPLIGSHQAISFLHRPLANLVRLLLPLLRCERRIRADAFDLGAGIVPDSPNLFHHGLIDAGPLHAVPLPSPASRLLRGRICGWWSALG
jgi:hypothetical protein